MLWLIYTFLVFPAYKALVYSVFELTLYMLQEKLSCGLNSGYTVVDMILLQSVFIGAEGRKEKKKTDQMKHAKDR